MADQGGMSPDWMQVLQSLSPTAEYTEQDKAIQDQLARAYAMRDRGQSQHTTGAGALFGGIGDILTQINGQKGVAAEKAQQRQLWQMHQKAIADAIGRMGQQQPQQQGAMAPPVDY